MMVDLKGISHTYSTEFVNEVVLQDVNLQIEEGMFCSIMGPSGSGKSTLLNIIGGLLNPTCGEVYIDGENISNYSTKQLANLRISKIGFIFQNFNLIPFLTVKENILLQVRLAKKNEKDYLETYNQLVTKLGIKEKENSYIYELSGGQQQRVAIARCLLIKPKIILADEPTGNLDSKNTNNFMKLLRSMAKENGMTVVIVTHDEKICENCDISIYINDGTITMVGCN